MYTFTDVTEFRRSPEALDFAKNWVAAQRSGEASSDWHINLLAWSSDHPVQVLGIVLNLIDLAIDDEDEIIPERVAMGPVEWLVEHAPEDFATILREAVVYHPGFALFTSGKRSSSSDPRWIRLNLFTR